MSAFADKLLQARNARLKLIIDVETRIEAKRPMGERTKDRQSSLVGYTGTDALLAIQGQYTPHAYSAQSQSFVYLTTT